MKKLKKLHLNAEHLSNLRGGLVASTQDYGYEPIDFNMATQCSCGGVGVDYNAGYECTCSGGDVDLNFLEKCSCEG